jgi:hypothetical protein
MDNTSQRRALRSYRRRLEEKGMARYEVIGLDTDRNLIRSLAKRLAGETQEAARIRTVLSQIIEDPSSKKGGILEALRRSPLVGADLNLSRSGEIGRNVDL